MAGRHSGVRVHELGQVVAGPFCGQVFADTCADVAVLRAAGVV